MMKTKYIIIVMALAVMMSSCFDSFDSGDPNGVNYDGVAWSSLEESEAGVTSVYSALYDDNLLAIEQFAMCADMGYPGYGRNTTDPTNDLLAMYYNHTYSNSATEVAAKWAALYTGIYRCNQVIESLDAMIARGDEMSDEWIEQMAQVRFFRGLFHFYLHSTYNNGEVVIMDYVPDDDEYYQTVSSYDEVLNFFRSDLIYAFENLPSSWPTNTGRVTRGSAAANLGASHLYEKEYDQAIYYFEDIINGGEYELVEDLDLMYTSDGELNSEAIFEVVYQLGIHPDLSYTSNASPTNELGYTGTTNSFTLPSWNTHLYQTEAMNLNDERNWIVTEEDDAGDAISKRERTMPLRGSSMIATVQDDDTWWYLEFPTSDAISVGASSAIGYYRIYTNWDIIDHEKNLPDGARKSGKNITVNRLSDVYLMYAECMLEKNDVLTALKYMNKIRQRWGLLLLGTPAQNPTLSLDESEYPHFDHIIYDAESLMTQLREVDRPLEISVQGHASRFIDLRRWGDDYMEKRFQELSEEVYYLAQRAVVDPDGSTGTRTRSSCWLQAEWDESFWSSSETLTNEYDVAASNFKMSTHSYWPIPLIEEQNNPNIYNK